MKELTAAIPQHLMADPKKDMPKAKNTIGKDDFMKLLMTQLQHQDPLKPMDHHEFASQLAQFGSLEQLTNIQKAIEGVHTGIGEESKLSALNMIGKRIQTGGSQVELIEGQNVGLKFNAKDDILPVKASIYTDGGKQVREIDLSRAEGTEIKWDGKDQEGKPLPSGKYTFRVQGVDKSGQAQEMGTELSGRVTGVEFEGKDAMLIIETSQGKSKMELSKVKQVMTEKEPAAAEAKPTSTAKPASPVTSAPVSHRSIPMTQSASDNEEESLPGVGELDKGMWAGIHGMKDGEGIR